MAPQDTNTRRIVEARMGDLGIPSYADLATSAGLDVNTISAVMAESGTPRAKTKSGLARALHWPPDWLDYVRRGETPPAVGQSTEVRIDHQSGATAGRSELVNIVQSAMSATLILGQITTAAGLTVDVNELDVSGASFVIHDEDGPVGVMDAMAYAARVTLEVWKDLRQMVMQRRLAVTVKIGDVPYVVRLGVYGLLDLPGAQAQLEELYETYDITTALDDDQLRSALTDIAGQTTRKG